MAGNNQPSYRLSDALDVIATIGEVREVLKRRAFMTRSYLWSGDRTQSDGRLGADPRCLLLTALDDVEREALAWVGESVVRPERFDD